jgi:hypothetical protein
MPESELLNQMLSDYIDANPAADKDPLKNFCVYVANWLIDHPVIGVGMTTSGMALRLADGRELSLVVGSGIADPATVTQPVSITGNFGNQISRGQLSDLSVAITKHYG